MFEEYIDVFAFPEIVDFNYPLCNCVSPDRADSEMVYKFFVNVATNNEFSIQCRKACIHYSCPCMDEPLLTVNTDIRLSEEMWSLYSLSVGAIGEDYDSPFCEADNFHNYFRVMFELTESPESGADLRITIEGLNCFFRCKSRKTVDWEFPEIDCPRKRTLLFTRYVEFPVSNEE